MITQKPFTIYEWVVQGKFLGSYVLQENRQWMFVLPLYYYKGRSKSQLVYAQIHEIIVYNMKGLPSGFRKRDGSLTMSGTENF